MKMSAAEYADWYDRKMNEPPELEPDVDWEAVRAEVLTNNRLLERLLDWVMMDDEDMWGRLVDECRKIWKEREEP